MVKLGVSALLLSFCLGLSALFLRPFWLNDVPVDVTIPPGLSAAETGRMLKAKGVIGSAAVFQLAAKFSGFDRKLKPGRYLMRGRLSIEQALKILKAGAANDIKVSIPEGFSARQIAERLEADKICKAQDFLKYVDEMKWEGYLYPATYNFDPEAGAVKAADRMHQEFKRTVVPEYEKANPQLKLTLHQVVTLASIVEREAVLPAEKPMIAAVYLNRLRIRKMLEADPTVQYALGYWKKGLTLKDLKDPSPYNTYNHYGLPPGPICSPSLTSVQSVLNPAQIDAIFFVADTKGGHRFTNTIEEHLKAKQIFKKDLRAIKERLKREAARK